jgi:hypothetical protein
MAVTNAMQINAIRARAEPAKKRRSRTSLLRIALVTGLAAAVAVTGWFDWYDGRLGILSPLPAIESRPGGGRILRVPPGGNIQAALNSAESGDIVELQAGTVYAGTITLPKKPLTDFVTIRSSAAGDLPSDKRVSPAQRHLMATITSGILGRPAVQASSGAHHYRFVGIEFTAVGRLFNYGVVVLGGGEKRPENVPHTIEIDRSYVHANGPTVSRRGIALNSADTTIKNSYIEGFAFEGEETQGICGWAGTRNVRVLNNYIEGGAENIMFGGADPANGELIPTDIEISGNHLAKPRAWLGKATMKTLFELKNAKRVKFTRNYLENNWKGSAFRITVRNQDGKAAFSTIEDVLIRDNIIDGAGEGVNILGRDDNYPSLTAKRLEIVNNLFRRIGGEEFEGSGYFVQISGGEEVTIANNTVFNDGNTFTFHGELPRGLTVRDNMIGHGTYGVHGLGDLSSASVPRFFLNNVIVNNKRVAPGDASVPPESIWLPAYEDVGFADLRQWNCALLPASRLRGKGSQGGDIGCSATTLAAQEVRSTVR